MTTGARRGWLPLLALVVVVGGAAGLGVAMQPSTSPPQHNTAISRFVAATEAAGTARFTETIAQVTGGASIPTPTTHATGVVDFRADETSARSAQPTVSTTSTNNGPVSTSVQWTPERQIVIGNRAYNASGPQIPRRWTESTSPVTATQMLGFGVWWLPRSSHVKATFVREAFLRGMTTSLFRYASSSGGSGSCPATPRVEMVVDMWVDAQSRLVQTRATMELPWVAGGFTATTTMQLSAFGVPVTITRPPVRPTPTTPPGPGGRPQSISGKVIASKSGTAKITRCPHGVISDRAGSILRAP